MNASRLLREVMSSVVVAIFLIALPLWAAAQDQPPASVQQQGQQPAPPAEEQNPPEAAQGQPAPQPPSPGRVPVSLTCRRAP